MIIFKEIILTPLCDIRGEGDPIVLDFVLAGTI